MHMTVSGSKSVNVNYVLMSASGKFCKSGGHCLEMKYDCNF